MDNASDRMDATTMEETTTEAEDTVERRSRIFIYIYMDRACIYVYLYNG